jgi:metal-sulfur cluster biosynthetic enzyme
VERDSGMNAPTVDRDEVLAVLNTIIDPCSRAAGAPAGLVDMGLVRELEVTATDAGTEVRVTIGVTEYGCMIAPSFEVEARKRLGALAGVGALEVDLDSKFDWEPDDMSPDYRRRLADHRSRTIGLPLLAARRPSRGVGPLTDPHSS